MHLLAFLHLWTHYSTLTLSSHKELACASLPFYVCVCVSRLPLPLSYKDPSNFIYTLLKYTRNKSSQDRQSDHIVFLIHRK